MAWNTIPPGSTDANSPLNETLVNALRENRNETMRSMPLLNWAGYQHTDGSPVVYRFDSSRVVIAGGSLIMADNLRIYIPDGITQVGIKVYAQASFAGMASAGVRVTINGVPHLFNNLGVAWGWELTFNLTPGAVGWQDVLVEAVNNSGADRTIDCRGITILPVVL